MFEEPPLSTLDNPRLWTTFMDNP